MSDCQKIQKILPDSLQEKPAGGEIEFLEKHLNDCPECRRTSRQFRQILSGAEAVRGDIREVMKGVDWEALSHRITDAALAGREGARKTESGRSFRGWVFSPPLKPVFAGLLAGIMIGAAATFFILNPRLPRPAAGSPYFASSDFIDQVEYELAKRETIEYLDKSQLLILDLIQDPSGRTQLSPGETPSARLKDVLAKKRYINQQLDKARMAKAREICDQIEFLLIELSQISGAATAEEAARVRDFVDQKQLLLKINLLRKELRNSEV